MLYLADLYFINDDGSYRLQWTNQALVDRVTHPGSVDDDNEYYQQLAKYQYLTDHLNDGSDRAVSYRVNIYNKNSGRCIYSTVVNDGTSLDVDLSPEEYLWEVEALDAHGRVITRSEKAYLNTECTDWDYYDAQVSYRDSSADRQMCSLGNYWDNYMRMAAGGKIIGENIEDATFIVCGPGECGNSEAWNIPKREGYMYSVSNAFGGFDGEFSLTGNCLITCGGIYEYEDGQWNYKMFTDPWMYGCEFSGSSSDYLLADEAHGNILYKWDPQQDKLVEVLKASSEIYYISDYYYVTKDGVFSIAEKKQVLKYNVEWGENPVFNDMFVNIMAENSNGSPMDILKKGNNGSIVVKYFFFEEDNIIEKEVELFSGKAPVTYDAEEIYSVRIGNCFCYVLQDASDEIEDPRATAIIHEISSDGSVKTHSFTCNTYEDITFSTDEYGNLQCSYYDCEEYDTVTRIYEDINLKFTPLFPDGDKIYAGNADEITFEGLTGNGSTEVIPGETIFTVEYSQNKFATTLSISTTCSKIDVSGLPAGKYDLRISANGGNQLNCKTITSSNTSTPQLFKSDNDEQLDLFFATVDGVWGNGYAAQHSVFKDIYAVSLSGKNHISNVFRGGDENILILTDDANGDALFLEDIFTEFGSAVARLSDISEIRAGNGDDIIDMTSAIYDYSGSHITIRGGNGNDTIWANGDGAVIFGDAGNDNIVGSAGDDIIAGGAGNDQMQGGGGCDVFCFGDNWGKDTITVTDGSEIALYFKSGSLDFWDEEARIYNDGQNSVKIKGSEYCRIELYFDEDTYFSELGAYEDATSRYIFEKNPPSQVTGLTITRTQTDSSVTLQWTASPESEGVTQYEIRLDGSNQVYRTNQTSYTISDLAIGGHFFTVTAVDYTGNHSEVSSAYEFNVVKTTVTEIIPTLPKVEVNGMNKTLNGVTEDALEAEEDRLWSKYGYDYSYYELVQEQLLSYLSKNNAYSESIHGTNQSDKITVTANKTHLVANEINLYDGDDQLILNAASGNNETALQVQGFIDFDAYFTINFGNGNDLLWLQRESSIICQDIEFGAGNDILYLDDNTDELYLNTIDFGDDDDIFYMGKNLDELFIDSINFGSGNDTAVFRTCHSSCDLFEIATLEFGDGNDTMQVFGTNWGTSTDGAGNTFTWLDMGEGTDTLEIRGTLVAEYIFGIDSVTGSGTVAFMEVDESSLQALQASGVELVNAGKGFVSKTRELADNSINTAYTLTEAQNSMDLWLAGSQSDAALGEFGFVDETDWLKVNITNNVSRILISLGEGVTCNIYDQNKKQVASYSSYSTEFIDSWLLSSLGKTCYLEFTVDQYSCATSSCAVRY